MTDREALLASVLATPDDDLPRLVYADWLRENGQTERADFIEVGVELARMKDDSCVSCWNSERGGPCCTGRAALQRRSAELLALYGHTWAGTGIYHQPSEVVRINTDDSGDVRPVAMWSRGFVERVSGTLAEWIGGECGRCEGYYFDRDDDCPNCSGTGRISGIGPAVVAAHPVEVVVLTDKEPDLIGDTDYCWLRSRGGLGNDRAQVPPEVFDFIEGGCREHAGPDWQERFGHNDEWVIFATRELALSTLSAALIAWAKS